MRSFRVVELYAGTGRSAHPFRRWPRANVSLLLDAWAHARETYLTNHPDAPYAQKVIGRHVGADAIETLAGGSVDILLGCPPCQGFSDAGGRDTEDVRNEHLSHFCRIGLALGAKVIALENVPGAALSMRFTKMVADLEAAGYSTTWQVVNSALAGSAQSRQRLLMLAFHSDLKAEPSLPGPTHGAGSYFNYRKQGFSTLVDDPIGLLGTTPVSQMIHGDAWRHVEAGVEPSPDVGTVLEGLPRVDTPAGARLDHVSWPHKISTLDMMEGVPEGGRLVTERRYFSHAYGRLHRRGFAKTLTTNFGNAGSGRFWHPTANRALTVREAARIQGFGDEFELAPGRRVENAVLVGNALDAAFANIIYESVRRVLE